MSLGPTLEKDMAPDGDSSHRLTELTAEATLKYAMKDYNTAAELYSQAMEMQAEINGEMSSDNSDLLYNYGRCLYHVAVQNSDVLGSRMANEKSDGRKKLPRQKRVAKPKPDDDETKPIIEEVITGIIEEKQSSGKPLKEVGNTSTPYFQITGDENFNTSDEEAGREELEGESEDTDEEDDFANAFEVLDLARILLLKKIEEDEANSEKSNTKSRTLRVQELQERLADTYDLQAEISLEGERYPNAVVDLSSALDLKRSLFPPDSSVIAEAHFKLSLALEFSSVTQQRNSDEGIPEARASHVDYAMREEAGKEMEAAIASCKLRIQKEESKLQDITQSNRSDAASKEVKTNIDEVKDMVGEMEQRVSKVVAVYIHSLCRRSFQNFASLQSPFTTQKFLGRLMAQIRWPVY